MPRQSEYMQRNPVRLDISRSRFPMAPRWTGSFVSYKCVPILAYTDILPGDTFKLSTSFVIRMSTPIAPVMDDLFLDVAFYFVPHELILSRSYMSPSVNDANHSWKAFIGAQDSLLNMPVPDGDIELPYMYVGNGGPAGTYVVGGIADCMGMPKPTETGVAGYRVNCLAALAFMAVWNENYRDPNLQNPGVFSIEGSGLLSITWSAATGNSYGQAFFNKFDLPNVCRLHGYFGSALPWPQRNNETVTMPLGDAAPVVADGALQVRAPYGNGQIGTLTTDEASNAPGISAVFGSAVPEASDVGYYSGLKVDLANASAVSINTFRLAVQEQRWYEALARGGNRIDELTAALFGVMPKDAGSGQPEYLGGKRIPINVSQVNVTANSDGDHNNAVGDTGAMSVTSDVDYYFTKSFDRWGSIIGVACVRFRDSFGLSLNKMYTRHERFDFYFPQFANLGEQPLYMHEADITHIDSFNGVWPSSDVFGYQEAWAEYRYIPDVVTGLVRPGKSLDHWTYANETVGTLAEFITGSAGSRNQSAAENVDRSLVVQSSDSGLQFLAQFQFDIVAVRPMPLYSIPGLVDHH